MGFLLSLLPGLRGLNFKLIAAILAILAVGGWGWYKSNQVAEARGDLIKVISERDEAVQARDKAIEANHTASLAIAALQREKSDIQTALNQLAADRSKSQKALNDLAAAINAQRNDPQNLVSLSPVLKLTVDTIQKQREARRATK